MVDALDRHVDAGPHRAPLAPVARHRLRARVPDQRVVAQAGDDQRMIAIPQPLERRQIHMIPVIVAHQHEIDMRQRVERDAGIAHARGPSRPHGPAFSA